MKFDDFLQWCHLKWQCTLILSIINFVYTPCVSKHCLWSLQLAFFYGLCIHVRYNACCVRPWHALVDISDPSVSITPKHTRMLKHTKSRTKKKDNKQNFHLARIQSKCIFSIPLLNLHTCSIEKRVLHLTCTILLVSQLGCSGEDEGCNLKDNKRWHCGKINGTLINGSLCVLHWFPNPWTPCTVSLFLEP